MKSVNQQLHPLALATTALLVLLFSGPALSAGPAGPSTAFPLLAMADDMTMKKPPEKSQPMGGMMGGMDMMSKPGMAGMGDKKMKGKMKDDAMPMAQESGAQMMAPSNADMMGKMRPPMQRDTAKMAARSALPGFPGASHLYHVGATDFFLDHPQHIGLTAAQQDSLNTIKEKALLDKANAERRIDDAEQELWTLTSLASPDAARIEAKVRQIEQGRAEQRLAYIRAVGEAAKVLSTEQQQAVLGAMSIPKKPVAPVKKAEPMPSMPMKME